jgi:Zn-dependent M28 family amino/carboxypeptidase
MTARTELGRAESANVVGLLEGSDPELRNEYVVFTAHLDHLGRGPAVDGDAIYNGALDNASGVAVMLEAARLLASTEPRPRRSILFVAVTGEENGLLGSGRFAQNPTVPKEQLVANVNMDMPVLLYPAAGLIAFGAEHSTLGEIARSAVEDEGLQLVPDPNPEEVFFVRSDQYSFVKEGIPALYLDDAPLSADPAVDANAVFKQHMVRDYHMPSDDMRLPIHWPSFAKLARVNARIGRSIADAAERPAWLPGDFFGEVFGKKAQ